MNTNEKIKENWEKTRAKGKFRFMLGGILLWGIVGTIISLLFDYAFEYFYEAVPNFQKVSENLFLKLLISLIIWSLIGFFIGWLSWNKNEREFSTDLKEK
jgi:membrane-anchored glycerophosphoryl diester phosphodiesterase (GDPDase)